MRLLKWTRLTLLLAALGWATTLVLGALDLGNDEFLYLSSIIAGLIVIASAVACVVIPLTGWIMRR